MQMGVSIKELDKQWHSQRTTVSDHVVVKIGNADNGYELKGADLDSPVKEKAVPVVDAAHAYIHGHLSQPIFEIPNLGRDQLPAVEIKCFSGLPWKYALLAYDAVRSYETVAAHSASLEKIASAREVRFSPAFITWEFPL